jgi:hypothetical protein
MTPGNIQYAQHDLARNHLGPTSEKLKKKSVLTPRNVREKSNTFSVIYYKTLNRLRFKIYSKIKNRKHSFRNRTKVERYNFCTLAEICRCIFLSFTRQFSDTNMKKQMNILLKYFPPKNKHEMKVPM